MGIAETLPGISGGSIAYITGIYQRLIDSLARISPSLRSDWLKRLVGFVRDDGVAFLLPLLAGMVLGLFVSVAIVVELLESHPTLIWGFVFGLVFGAAVQFVLETKFADVFYLGVALCVGLGLTYLGSYFSVAPGANLLLYLIGGFVVFCVWILPGISGSMVLLMFGLWEPLLHAVRNLEWLVIASTALGILIGVLLVPKYLSRLFLKYHVQMKAIFAGLIISTLPRVWPWQSDESGTMGFLPAVFFSLNTLFVFGLMTLGFIFILVLRGYSTHVD